MTIPILVLAVVLLILTVYALDSRAKRRQLEEDLEVERLWGEELFKEIPFPRGEKLP